MRFIPPSFALIYFCLFSGSVLSRGELANKQSKYTKQILSCMLKFIFFTTFLLHFEIKHIYLCLYSILLIMKYFYDTEFLEGTQKKRFLGIPYGITRPTIDLISIGIVSNGGQEYYAVSKDFNLKEAWNRYDKKSWHTYAFGIEVVRDKDYWIRENVLRPIFDDWNSGMKFNYKNFKKMLNKYGKTTEQISEDIRVFVYRNEFLSFKFNHELGYQSVSAVKSKISFYGYYSAYDHVALCWLFGKMIDLPTGFPMWTNDLKQMLDETLQNYNKTVSFFDSEIGIDFIENIKEKNIDLSKYDLKYKLDFIKKYHSGYPKQVNEHHALADARWNKKLYEFLKKL